MAAVREEDVAASDAAARSTRLPWTSKLFRYWRVPFVWVVVCAGLWVGVGLFGREPFKPDEGYTVGLVKSVVDSGDWVVPRLAGEPFMEKPPLFFVVAAGFARATSRWLPLHEGARLATVLFVGLGLAAVGGAARVLFGVGAGSAAVLLLLSTFGALFRLHQLITDTALFAGMAVALLGLSLAATRPQLGGGLTGLGAALGFLAKGLLGPGIIVVTAMLLPFGRRWRTATYAQSLLWALLVVACLASIWPAALYLRSPSLFREWIWDNNFGRYFDLNGLGPKKDALLYLRLGVWFAWPCWPLILWWLYRRARGDASEPGAAVPLAMLAVGFAVLSLASDGRDLYALVLLPPLAVAATAGLRGISARVELAGARFLALFAVALSAVIAFVWIRAWIDPAFVRRLPRLLALPEMIMPSATVLTVYGAIAVLLLVLLLQSVQRRWASLPLAGAAGAALAWATLMLPWHDYVNDLKGYSRVAASLRGALPAEGCVASRALGESERALLDYFIGLKTRRLEVGPAADCRLLLVQLRRELPVAVDLALWEPVWQGARPGTDTSTLRLYRRR